MMLDLEVWEVPSIETNLDPNMLSTSRLCHEDTNVPGLPTDLAEGVLSKRL